ncbi:hypothetical protein VTK26DRAFT_1651 [Humicola hyalothermophila]
MLGAYGAAAEAHERRCAGRRFFVAAGGGGGGGGGGGDGDGSSTGGAGAGAGAGASASANTSEGAGGGEAEGAHGHGRRLGVRFGWGVDGVKEGDVVVVFEGGRWPFVLREVEGGEEGKGVGDAAKGGEGKRRYRIVGDCYLHGIMDGEAMEDELGEEMEFAVV